jgi:hypothetical protein
MEFLFEQREIVVFSMFAHGVIHADAVDCSISFKHLLCNLLKLTFADKPDAVQLIDGLEVRRTLGRSTD